MAAERLSGLPSSLRGFLAPRATRHDPLLVPDAVPVSPPPLPDLGGARRVASAQPAGETDGEREPFGSNNWAVSGALTKSGKPMLANDPHLGFGMPALWLPMRFVIGGRRVEGVTLPGMPGVILGRNDGMAWAFTNLMADIADLYRETIVGGKAQRAGGAEAVVMRIETIAVRGGEPDRWEVRETSHGPLVTRNLALRWTALDPRNLRLPTAEVLLAADPASFDRALDGFLGPPQNVVWASRGGHIGWRAAGLLPARRPGTDGSVPYDGRDPRNDWLGTVPMEKLPRVVDPPEGFLVTANQRTIGSSFPWVVTTDWASPARALRIRELIEAARREGRKLDRDAMEAIQMDVVSTPLRALVPPFLPHLPKELASEFANWDGRAAAESRAFLVARALKLKLRENALKAWRVRRLARWMDDDQWVELVNAPDEAFLRAGLGAKDAFLKRCVNDALAELERRFGKERSRWRWGDANRLAARHPLGRIPGLALLFDPPSEPQTGHSTCVKASSTAYGQSMRFLVDWEDPEAATLVVPFGVSGHLGSPHRLDELPFWLRGDRGGAATRLARPVSGESLRFAP